MFEIRRIEWIDGTSVRKVLGGGAEGEEEVEVAEGEEMEVDEQVEVDELKEVYGLTEERMMTLIGEEIAKMHKSDIIHGDLTTSNMMLRRRVQGQETQLVLIDFGLSYNSALVEDKAVDLYVLERAFASTHPQSEGMFNQVLQAYERVSGSAWKNIKRRLDDALLSFDVITIRLLHSTITAHIIIMPSDSNNQILDESKLSLSERRNHNNQQPINKLPDTLLSRIFIVTTESSIKPRSAYRFTLFPDIAIQVCSQWMRVALASPTLWTHLRIREHFDDDDIALWVSRAGKDTLLDIEIAMLEPYCGVAFFDITDTRKQVYHIERIFKFFCSIKAGPQRWRSLSLSVLQPEPLYKFIQLLNKQPAPNLRYLYLSSEPDRSDDEFDEGRPLTKAHYGKAYSLSEHAVPNLRHAELIYVSWKYVFDRPKPLLSGLTTLDLSAGSWIPSPVLPSIQKLLSSNPSLESLRLSAEFVSYYESDDFPDNQRPRPVQLSSLKTLSLEVAEDIILLLDMLSIISAPFLESLSLSSTGLEVDDELAASITSYIVTGQLPGSKDSATDSASKPLFPLIRKLDITGLPFDDQNIADILASSPLVTHLSLGYYQAKPSMDKAPRALPRLEVLSLQCYVKHKHYRELEELLTQRVLNGTPIPVVEISADSDPEPDPGFQERFPGTVLKLRRL
ncbi:hypothetical protein RSOLAG22IIIB_07364 [Rhizoctonia solani]|uniref:non-specific serine/threonine protein kinase n=1 Tax=Rhizoctonia solani TaxID=456999 RepID=A0A0K6FMH0_9AGAM|nr:hypothetical protein RSOLAG22IIIB_07364 [Rhizoctonia solani]